MTTTRRAERRDRQRDGRRRRRAPHPPRARRARRGTRLFSVLDAASAKFERKRVIDADGVTHLRFRLVK